MKNRHRLPAALLLLLLAACGSAPPAPQPARIEAALQIEQDGARRYARGEFVVAAPRFGEAARLFASIDDATGATRNTLHQVRAELAAGQAVTALNRLTTLHTDAPAWAIDIAQLQVQAHLALSQTDAAATALAAALEKCAPQCPHTASLQLLAAHLALAKAHPQEALTHAATALQHLQNQDQAAETANAWRLTAAAQLALKNPDAALTAAQAALEIDRRLALPEKLVRDWLLIGDSRRAEKPGAGETTDKATAQQEGAGQNPARFAVDALQGGRANNTPDAVAAYQRALDIALAAGLDTLAERARQALMTAQSGTP
ncbi:MAG: hypothetical protein HZB64_11315 [Rhodocyclales bacterium]|nr:hypothetical protein [Rhodocyclales bacterium]